MQLYCDCGILVKPRNFQYLLCSSFAQVLTVWWSIYTPCTCCGFFSIIISEAPFLGPLLVLPLKENFKILSC